ncbi:MAG: periplasmic binding protein [Anaerolineaceae bacterium]|nr:MAG: periplasmic binding protein [Anaerolineaceae bacterium]
MKRITLSVLLFALLLAACTPQATATPAPAATLQPATLQPSSLTITDALGRAVTLPALPRRIVIAGKGLFMIADAAYLFPEASERIVGLGNAGQGTSNFISLIDPDFAGKVILESNAGAEQIAALQPDLVILKSYLAETTGAPIEALGIPVIYVDFETPEQYARDLEIFGKVFGNEARAAEVAAYYQERMDAIQQTAGAAEKPRTLLLYYNNKDGNVAFNVPPMGWIQTRMVQMAGGDPVWADAALGNGWTQVALEQIAAWDADVILIVAYNANSSDVAAGLEADPNWQALRAVQENRLYAFPADLYSWDQPDPRWILGLTWLAGRLHPDLFAHLDPVAEARNFYASLYGLDAAFFDQNILPTFKGDLP